MTAMSGNKQQESHHFFLLRARWKKNNHWHALHWDLEVPPYMGANNVGAVVFNLSIIISCSQNIVHILEM